MTQPTAQALEAATKAREIIGARLFGEEGKPIWRRKWADVQIAELFDAFAEQRAAEARAQQSHEGHNAPCYYCGEPCNDLAGDPGLWSIPLTHPEDPGKVKWHHTRCIFIRLHPDPIAEARAKALEEADELLCELAAAASDIARRVALIAASAAVRALISREEPA